MDPTYHPGFTQEEYNQLLRGSSRRAPKSPELFAKYKRTAWWARRREKYKQTHPKCEGCRQRPGRQVHHIRYSFFCELDADLQHLCGRCHMGFQRR